MTAASQGADMETRTVDAYIYLHSPNDSGRSENQSILGAFEQAVTDSLSAAGPGRALDKHVLKQTFDVLGDPASCASLRSLRQRTGIPQFEAQHRAEVVLLSSSSDSSSPQRRPVRLAVFDMDSTLIDEEVIDELARSIGKTEAVSAITAAAMRGELDFAASLRQRVGMLRGVRADIWTTLRASLHVAVGAHALCAYLKSRDATLAVFSGGFQPMAEWLQGELGLDVAAANHLVTAPATAEFPFEHLTGELVEGKAIVNAEYKRTLLCELAASRGVSLAETLCVGDGANDLPMLQAVGDAGGIAVACRAKPAVQQQAPNRLDTTAISNKRGLENLVWLFDDEARLAE